MELRLGHITYSNCFPVHARLIDAPGAGDPALVHGVPGVLNDLLERGRIQVAPSSSIEFARHADRYDILPDLVIGSRGAVRSILLLSDRAPADLDGCTVAVPTASATSVVLLKILLRNRWKVRAHFVWFDQARQDPFAEGVDAALFIGDVALQPHTQRSTRLDLGAEWTDETGLPFVFALWQASGGSSAELRLLHQLLLESRRYGEERMTELAERYTDRFSMPPDVLRCYWRDLTYQLDSAMLEGLTTFFRLAAEAGEIARVPELRWI